MAKKKKAELAVVDDGYDAADNARKCYDLAIETMREKLESFRCERIGPHQLYMGDCREILPLLPRADAIVTDPPYGIEGTWSGGSSNGWGRFKGDAERWDTRPDWFAEWVVEQNCPAIVWGGNYFPLPPSGSWLVLDKLVREFTSGHCELAWTNLGKPVRAFNFSHGQLATEGKHHPTQKPVPLMKWCIEHLPSTVSTILDPFAGSGTTGVAAQKLGRKFVGVESDPKYFSIACKRIEEAMRQPDLFVAEPAPKAEQLDMMGSL